MRADLGMLLIKEKKRVEAGLKELTRATELRPRLLEYRLALLDHGIGVLPPEQVRQILRTGLEHHPAAVMLSVMEAAFILEYAVLTPDLYRHVVDLLTGVFRTLP